jgi:Na+/melibiose symporter-like transporter
VLALILVLDARDRESGAAFDWRSSLLSGAALAALGFGLELTTRPTAMIAPAGLLIAGGVLTILYLRHARRVRNAILDLKFLDVPSFRISVVAGSLTRVTQGAQPFLLPFLFQMGFGMSAAKTGTITLGSALGALIVKPLAPGLIRSFGHRDPLLVGSMAASLGYASCAAFRPDWPASAMFAVLLVSVFLMSLLFTGYNALAFIDVERLRMNAATSFYATTQQLSLSVGICLATILLQIAQSFALKVTTGLAPYAVAFFGVAALSAFAAKSIVDLPRSVGRRA